MLNAIGAQWSQLQRLVAALSVGIGFGLQEIVANFIGGRLLNWSLSDQATRIVLSVGIAYGSDVREAMRLLGEAARENKDVLDDPAPSVIFEAFGDNSLALALRCFVESVDLRFPTVSALNQAINDEFNAAGIAIAFPQRDLHLDMRGPLRVHIEDSRQVHRSTE